MTRAARITEMLRVQRQAEADELGRVAAELATRLDGFVDELRGQGFTVERLGPFDVRVVAGPETPPGMFDEPPPLPKRIPAARCHCPGLGAVRPHLEDCPIAQSSPPPPVDEPPPQ